MKLTVRQYQELYAIYRSDDDDTDKIIQAVAAVTGKTAREIEEMPVSEVNRISRETQQYMLEQFKPKPKDYIKANGKLYGISYDMKVRAGQFIEVQYFTKPGSDVIENLHKIIASISYPVKKYGPITFRGKNKSENHEQVAEDFKEASFEDVYGACLFFFSALKRFNRRYPGLFGEDDNGEHEHIEGEGEAIYDGFTDTYGWIYNAELVAKLEKIKLSEVYDMDVIHFLNDLSYLKAKDHHDKQLMKRARYSEQ